MEDERVGGTPLLEKVVENGERVAQRRDLREIRDYCLEQVAKMPAQTRELRATPYEFRESQGLKNLVDTLTKHYAVGDRN